MDSRAIQIWRPQRNHIYCMDALELCAQLPAQSVDMILTDPPYGTTACSWDVVVPFDAMWAAFKRVMKPRGAVVMTAAGKFTHLLAMSNFDWLKYEWVWNKGHITQPFNASFRPLPQHEWIMIFYENQPSYFPQMKKGRAYKKRGVGASEVYSSNRITSGSYGAVRFPTTILDITTSTFASKHPTQKPVALFEYLIKTYTRPGAIVLDPFAGSGTTAVACKITGRDFICGDTSAEYVELASRRVNPEFGKAPKRARQPEPLTDLPLFAGVTL